MQFFWPVYSWMLLHLMLVEMKLLKWIIFLILRLINVSLQLIFVLLILYLATFLNSFISSNSVIVESLELPIYKITSSANKDSFITSFPVESTECLFFLFLIALDRSSSTILNRSEKSWHLCLVSGLREKAFSVSPLSVWH